MIKMHHSLPSIIAAFAAVSHASPVETPAKPRLGFTYTANLTLSESSQNLNPVLAHAWPYVKYGATMPKPVQQAVAKQAVTSGGSSGSVTATPEPTDVEYLIPVVVAGKTMNLVLDSGSSDLWVYSDLMPSSQQTGHAIYKTNKAKIKSGQTFLIKYGDGSYSKGDVYTGTVSIGGVSFSGQAIEAASEVSASFLSHADVDGLIGLSMSSLNTVRPTPQNTFFDNVKSNLAIPMYAVTLKQGAVGSLDFGYIDRSKYTGALTYVNVNPANANFWQFLMKRYAIAGVEQKQVSPFVVIVDTGTSLTYLPSAIVQNYYGRIKGAYFDSSKWGAWVFPCDSTIPYMGLFIGGVKYSMSPAVLNWERLDGTYCYGGVQSSDSLPFSILGDVFLKSFYVVFDYSIANQPRVGFAYQNTKA